MLRKIRIVVYIIGIVLLLAEIRFHWASAMLNKAAIRRVQYLAQYTNQEYVNSWLGIKVLQYPSDLITYADLVYRLRPDFIIETGTYYGGLSVYLADVLENTNPEGRVLTIDISGNGWKLSKESGKIPTNLLDRIVFIEGDSASSQVYETVASYTKGKKALVILDSLHTREQVLKELNLYSKFVPVGSYVVVNDTHFEFFGLDRDRSGRGPLEAVKEFLRMNSEFEIDHSLPRSYISCAPSGFLRRVKEL